MAEVAKRYAIVTGSNQGIGFGTVKLLASNGVMTVLTALDKEMGNLAVEKLKEFGHSDLVVFHQLDVRDRASIASLEEFVKTQFGKLDILVNNAGVSGTIIDPEAFKAASAGMGKDDVEVNWNEIMTETYELAEECVKTNYYGAKNMTKVLLPLLQLSDSPRVVNVTSAMGTLKHIPNEWARGVLSSNAENLTEERVEQVLNEYLSDYKEDMLHTKGWPDSLSGYILSKAALNAYTRIMAEKYPKFCVNCVHPGFVKTASTFDAGDLTIDEAAVSVVRLAMLPNGSPSGFYFSSQEVSSF